MFYRRRLPHWIPDGAIIFLTWRLAGSLPVPPPEVITLEVLTGKADDKTRSSAPHSGPFWLRNPQVAAIIANPLQHGESVRKLYRLYAWVIMPNHVHVILQPQAELPSITRWLKGRTARMANKILGRRGTPFWQDESFDHWIRSDWELQMLIEYVESNPVKSGMVQVASEWPWTSAALKRDGKTWPPIPL